MSGNYGSTTFWKNENMLKTRWNMILHDPECESQCCAKNFEKPLQSSNYDDLEQLFTDEECSSVESTSHLTPTVSENQFLHFDMHSYNDAQVPECREKVSYLCMEYTNSCHDDLAKVERFSVKARQNQVNQDKDVIKRKRKRTVFTTEQIITMEGVFKKRPYVCREERLFLTKKLNISEKAIKVWFQNRRRITEKKEKNQCDAYHSDSTIEEMYDTHTARLDYIESQINENTDEYGYVTLNNKTISELVKVIDTVLCHNTEYNNSSYQDLDVSQNENYLMYEPISPESSSDEITKAENVMKWKPSKPEESLQRLIDIQTVLCVSEMRY